MKTLLPKLLALVLLFGVSIPAGAIYEKLDGDYTVDIRGNVRILASYARYPSVEELYPDEATGTAAAVGRLLIQSDLGKHISLEFNGFQQAVSVSVPNSSTQSLFSMFDSIDSSGQYRWDKGQYKWFDESGVTALMEVDRINVKIHAGPVEISLGRQPINHTVTYIWPVNDFFQAFSPFAFNTIFKPGVDAAKIDVAIGYTSGISVAGVCGFAKNEKDHDYLTWDESAVLGRAYTLLWNFEWAIMGGKTAWQYVAGASFQGELGPIGVRGEGHGAFPIEDEEMDEEQQLLDPYVRFAAGVDYRFANTLHLMGEYFYHGDGETRPENYLLKKFPRGQMNDPYLGRHYAAISASYEITPLLIINMTAAANVVDPSGMATAFLTYSLSDEAEFVGGASVPVGESPEVEGFFGFAVPDIQSEYGLYPTSFFLETRFYF